MHRGRVELLYIAYWTLSEIRLGTSMLIFEMHLTELPTRTMLSGLRQCPHLPPHMRVELRDQRRSGCFMDC
jgi:hypothetical protein